MTRKLVSRRGTLLGTITFPDHWGMTLQRDRAVRFEAALNDGPRSFYQMAEDATFVAHRSATILEDYWPEYPDSVTLHGLTLEEFEMLPGCSFAPGAAYMRSLIER